MSGQGSWVPALSQLRSDQYRAVPSHADGCGTSVTTIIVRT